MRNARESILKVAMERFAEKGYAGCSIREICQSAGVTKPVLYYHFQSKEHLFRELMLDIFSDTRKNLLRLEKSDGSARERLIRFVESEYADTRRDPACVRLIFRMMFSPEEGYPFFNCVEEFQRERRILANCVLEGAAPENRTIDAEMVSTALMGAMLMQILEFLFTGKRTLTRRNAEKLVDLHLSGS